MVCRGLTLEQVAFENGPNAVELIKELLKAGANPLEPNSQKLLPYHFAQNNLVFEALTAPPIDSQSFMVTLARSNASECYKIRILESALFNMLPLIMGFTGEDKMTCIGIAAQRREYRFAQTIGYAIKTQMDRLFGGEQEVMRSFLDDIKFKDKQIRDLQDEINRLKHKSTIDKENDTKSLDTEKCGNLPTENDNIKMKNEDFENLKKESAGNDKLENKDSNKEEILKAEILNLNKGITRKTEKCSDLSAEIDEIKKEFKMLIKRHSEVKQNLAGITKKASESKKENENLKIEVDKLKRDAKLRRVQSEKTINKLQNEKEELRKTLNRAQNFKMRAHGQIRQLNELFGINNTSFGSSCSEKRVKELEDEKTALNVELESLAKKYEQVTSCSLCDEKYESTGERSPVKLKCSHIFCSHCAYSWLESQGNKSSCPSCRTPYRSEDIRFVNLNADL